MQKVHVILQDPVSHRFLAPTTVLDWHVWLVTITVWRLAFGVALYNKRSGGCLSEVEKWAKTEKGKFALDFWAMDLAIRKEPKPWYCPYHRPY
jgi:hypothetical protein